MFPLLSYRSIVVVVVVVSFSHIGVSQIELLFMDGYNFSRTFDKVCVIFY